MNQITSEIFMIRPKHFNFNHETAKNNHFQKEEKTLKNKEVLQNAISEFEELVKKIKQKNIKVEIFEDREEVITTDSIFPNNWISLHKDGKIYVYPMFSEIRRKEKRIDIINSYRDNGYLINETIDLSKYEKENKFLEGTGSMVLDRENKLCYAAISERTSREVLNKFCEISGYEAIEFKSYQTFENKRKEIYHTNVMMCIADKYVIICLDSIDNIDERKSVIEKLIESKKEIIEINEKQCNNFAGNMLQVKNNQNKKFLIMSKSAYDSLSKEQLKLITSHNEIIYSSLDTIEKLGGGSARCMITENFLRRK
ncbi:MAG: citrulline utilization hydrolase CtlX [Cytophagales bacterium]